jgi:hypothetical protein
VSKALPDVPPLFPVVTVVPLVPPSKVLYRTVTAAPGQSPVSPVAVDTRNATVLDAVPDEATTCNWAP